MAKSFGGQRESDGVVVPLIGVHHNAPGGKGPNFEGSFLTFAVMRRLRRRLSVPGLFGMLEVTVCQHYWIDSNEAVRIKMTLP